MSADPPLTDFTTTIEIPVESLLETPTSVSSVASPHPDAEAGAGASRFSSPDVDAPDPVPFEVSDRGADSPHAVHIGSPLPWWPMEIPIRAFRPAQLLGLGLLSTLVILAILFAMTPDPGHQRSSGSITVAADTKAVDPNPPSAARRVEAEQALPLAPRRLAVSASPEVPTSAIATSTTTTTTTANTAETAATGEPADVEVTPSPAGETPTRRASNSQVSPAPTNAALPRNGGTSSRTRPTITDASSDPTTMSGPTASPSTGSSSSAAESSISSSTSSSSTTSSTRPTIETVEVLASPPTELEIDEVDATPSSPTTELPTDPDAAASDQPEPEPISTGDDTESGSDSESDGRNDADEDVDEAEADEPDASDTDTQDSDLAEGVPESLDTSEPAESSVESGPEPDPTVDSATGPPGQRKVKKTKLRGRKQIAVAVTRSAANSKANKRSGPKRLR